MAINRGCYLCGHWPELIQSGIGIQFKCPNCQMTSPKVINEKTAAEIWDSFADDRDALRKAKLRIKELLKLKGENND